MRNGASGGHTLSRALATRRDGPRRAWRRRAVLGATLAVLVAGLASVQPLSPTGAAVRQGPAPVGFQTGTVDDSLPDLSPAQPRYLSFPARLANEEEDDEEEECPPRDGDCPRGRPEPAPIPASMTATISNPVVIAGGQPSDGLIGGDVLEFDVTIENTSPADSRVVVTAYAFQSKHSESPALGSRIGDKLLAATQVGVRAGPGTPEANLLTSIKKNGTSSGLYSGAWKGICITSSVDFLPQFNVRLDDESLECAGARTDADGDGEPELDTNLPGLRPGQSQTLRLRLDSGTTDGALHRVPAGTITGTVGPRGDGLPGIETPGTAREIVDLSDSKVLFDAAGGFDPGFAPAPDFTLDHHEYLTLPRVNHAFTDILGRNHTCGTYGLTQGRCEANAWGSPYLGFLDTGDLVNGVQNFAAILHGFGEYVEVAPGEFERPSQPYGVRCGHCAGAPFTPIAEFYVDNGDGSVTRQLVGGSYGELGSDAQYTAVIDAATAEDFTHEILPDTDAGGPPSGRPLGTSATGTFYDLTVVEGGGTNGGDAVEFNVDVSNTSSNPEAHLTAFNFQTKERGLADIGRLDGTTQDRRNIVTDPNQPACGSPTDGVCYNPALGIGHFPNVIGNGLLFGQMVWTDPDAGREPHAVDGDQVFVDPDNGVDPTPFWLESVKKNGPFTPILRGNENFICVKSGLFDVDPDADTECAGEPAELVDPDGEPVPGNISQRLGLPAGETQTVRLRMDFGDLRGVLLRLQPGALVPVGDPGPDFGLRRFLDCADQRELEFCHPDKVGASIGYLPDSTARWLTPGTLDEIEYVVLNQPGTAPTVMNFRENLGFIMAMAGFVPSAEFYAPDPNPALVGTELEGILIRQQVMGDYASLAPIGSGPSGGTRGPDSTIESPTAGPSSPAGAVSLAATQVHQSPTTATFDVK